MYLNKQRIWLVDVVSDIADIVIGYWAMKSPINNYVIY